MGPPARRAPQATSARSASRHVLGVKPREPFARARERVRLVCLPPCAPAARRPFAEHRAILWAPRAACAPLERSVPSARSCARPSRTSVAPTANAAKVSKGAVCASARRATRRATVVSRALAAPRPPAPSTARVTSPPVRAHVTPGTLEHPAASSALGNPAATRALATERARTVQTATACAPAELGTGERCALRSAQAARRHPATCTDHAVRQLGSVHATATR